MYKDNFSMFIVGKEVWSAMLIRGKAYVQQKILTEKKDTS